MPPPSGPSLRPPLWPQTVSSSFRSPLLPPSTRHPCLVPHVRSFSTYPALHKPYVHRSYSEKARRRKAKLALIPKPPNPFATWKLDPTRCTGCGVKFQADTPTKPGYIYTSKAATSGRDQINSKRKYESDLFYNVKFMADENIQKKLENLHVAYKKPDELTQRYEARSQLQEETPMSERTLKILSSRPEPLKARPEIANLCRRCHELTYHSNPMKDVLKVLPVPKTIDEIIDEIKKDNTDPENPPLIVHVLDLADFPLSFVPFTIPEGSKVLFVVNRADMLCPRGSKMPFIRHYFEQELKSYLKKAGMEVPTIEVVPMSAEKGWGAEAVILRIFQLRNKESNVYLIGNTNVGKSSVVAAMIDAAGYDKDVKLRSDYKLLSPTVSVFPHTTLDQVEVPLNAFRRESKVMTFAKLYDTPGIESDSTYFQSLISHEYSRAVSLLKRGGYSRPAEPLHPGQSLILGGLFRLDLLECIPHPGSNQSPHIRVTPFTNLPIHKTSTSKAIEVFHKDPSDFWSRKSTIEVVTTHAVGSSLRIALDLDVKSTKNSERNAIEIVIAGMGFIAIGGNFDQAKIQVWTPDGRGVGIRRPIVERIMGQYSLQVVWKRPTRMIHLGNKSQFMDIKKKIEAKLAKGVETKVESQAAKVPEVESQKVESQLEGQRVEIPKLETPALEHGKMESQVGGQGMEIPKAETEQVESQVAEIPKVEIQKVESQLEGQGVELPTMETRKMESQSEVQGLETHKVETQQVVSQTG